MGYSELMPAVWAAAHLHVSLETRGQCTIHVALGPSNTASLGLLGLYRKGG